MEIEVLVSTMNLKNEKELIKRMNIKTKYTIINQTKNVNEVKSDNVYNYNEKGLSKSRNRALSHAIEEICLIADDDVEYLDNYEEIIKSAYKKHKDADIITFYIKSLNPDRPVKKVKSKRINEINAMRIISSQISFKKQSLINNNITFDEDFGAGSKYDKSEETIMLVDALKKGLKVININETIGTVQQESSTWYKGFNQDFIFKQGASFYRMDKRIYVLLIIQYAIRKYQYYKQNLTFIEAIANMLRGAKKYRKDVDK